MLRPYHNITLDIRGCDAKYFFNECSASNADLYTQEQCMRIISHFVISVYNVDLFLNSTLRYQVRALGHESLLLKSVFARRVDLVSSDETLTATTSLMQAATRQHKRPTRYPASFIVCDRKHLKHAFRFRREHHSVTEPPIFARRAEDSTVLVARRS